MSRFHFSCECKMQMTPSCDSFMTAVDSLHCSWGRNLVTPIRRPNLLSDSLNIGSIIQRAHQSYRQMVSVVIEGEMSELCVCLCLCGTDTETALGDGLIFSILLSFLLYLFCFFICFHLPVCEPSPLSALCVLLPFILFIILFCSLVHCLASLSFELFFLFEHFLLHLLFFFMRRVCSSWKQR